MKISRLNALLTNSEQMASTVGTAAAASHHRRLLPPADADRHLSFDWWCSSRKQEAWCGEKMHQRKHMRVEHTNQAQ